MDINSFLFLIRKSNKMFKKLNILFFGIFLLFNTLILLTTQNIFETILSCGVMCCFLIFIYFVYIILLEEDLQTKTFVLLFLWIIVLVTTLVLASHKIWLIVSSIPFVCIFIFDIVRKIKNFIISDKIHIRIFQLSLIMVYCGSVLYFCNTREQMIYMFSFGIFIILFSFAVICINEALKQEYRYKTKRKKSSFFKPIDPVSYHLGVMSNHH